MLFFYKRRPGERPPVVRASPYRVIYFASMLLLIGLAGWLYLYQASQVASYAREIRQLEWEKERLHRDMVALRAEIAMLGSLERLMQAAEALGYRLPDAGDSVHRLTVEYQLPSVASVETPGPLPEAEVVHVGQSLFRRLMEQLEEWLRTPVED